MEEKLKRECKPYLEKLFKKHDELGSAAVTHQAMIKILNEMIPEYTPDEELTELMKEASKRSKYTQLNKSTNQFEVRYQEDCIDFPAALYICVHFLKKLERRNTDCFSGRSTVNFSDLSGMTFNALEASNQAASRRLY